MLCHILIGLLVLLIHATCENKEGVGGGLVLGGMGVEEVGGGWAGGVVDDFEEEVEVVGQVSPAVRGTEVVVAVAAEGWGLEFKGVEPL